MPWALGCANVTHYARCSISIYNRGTGWRVYNAVKRPDQMLIHNRRITHCLSKLEIAAPDFVPTSCAGTPLKSSTRSSIKLTPWVPERANINENYGAAGGPIVMFLAIRRISSACD